MASAKESKITFLYGELNRLGHNGEYERAIKTANKILHDNPDEVKAFHCKIVSLIHLSKFQDGLNFISKNTKLSSVLIFEKAYCQYRMNQPQEALKTINAVATLTPKLKELKSQILYRLERYEECLDVYRDIIKNSSDEYEDERETNLAAVVANLSFSNSKVLRDLPPPRDHTYELAYNGACRLLGERKWLETEGKLREAERLCRETLEEDGASEEDVDEELAIIRIQMAYCLQVQGRGKEAQALYNSVLQSTRKPRSGEGEGETVAPPSGLDPSLLAVASNNLVAFNRDGNVFDSKKRMRAATAEGLEHRLTSRQQACIALNNCLMAFYTNQTDQCKQLCGKLAQEHPEFAVDAVLVQASALAREGKADAGVALLRSTKVNEDGARLAVHLATAQLLLSQGKVSEACSVLLGLGGETTFRPGVVSALVALCLASGDRSGASSVLKQAVEWYRRNKAEGGDLRMLWRHAADFHLRGGDAAVAARSLEELLRLDPKDTKTMAQLVIAFSQFDPKKAQGLSRQLPAVKDDSIDVDALETSNWTMGSKVIKKTVAGGKDSSVPSPGSKPTTPGEELLVKVSKRPRRRRKGKLPKNYDPESTPDPERWLPRHERTGFRKKKDRRAAKDVGKGTQGAASGASDLYDITKMQPTGGASPSMRHGSPGEPGPRQQQRKGQQQKKKRKGTKW